MKQCWKCRSTVSENMVHHVDGNHENEKPQNLLRLCLKCHDLIQGICDRCDNQKCCYVQKLQRCWAFEDALPHIYFMAKNQEMEDLNNSLKNKRKWLRRPLETSTQGLDTILCDICGKFYIWQTKNEIVSITCPYCLILLAGHRIQRKTETPKED